MATEARSTDAPTPGGVHARTPKWLKAAIRYGLFPLNFTLAIAAAFSAVDRGWDPSLTLVGITAPTVVIIFIAERLSPYFPSWNQSRGDVGTDATHVFVSMIVLPPLLEIAIHAAVVGVAAVAASGTWTGTSKRCRRLHHSDAPRPHPHPSASPSPSVISGSSR